MHEFPAPSPLTVVVEVPAGSIEVIAEERDSATVTVEPYDNREESRSMAQQSRVDLSGHTLTVSVPDGSRRVFRRAGAVRAEIRVPRDSSVRGRTASAGTSCLGRFAELTVASDSGDVSVGHVTGDASVKLASGNLRVERVEGSFSGGSASGDLTIGIAEGSVAVRLASGNVEIGECGADVRVVTASGDVRIGSSRRGAVRVGTASGDVSVGVPAGTGVWLDLNSVSGDARNGLTMVDQIEEQKHDLALAIRTVSGDIHVHRAG